MSQLIIDLDGTICTEEKIFNRGLATPLPGAKEALDKFKEEGHTIIIYSARGWNEYDMTIRWLKSNYIPYDQVVLGKPIGQYWIDDRAIRFTSWEKIAPEVK